MSGTFLRSSPFTCVVIVLVNGMKNFRNLIAGIQFSSMLAAPVSENQYSKNNYGSPCQIVTKKWKSAQYNGIPRHQSH